MHTALVRHLAYDARRNRLFTASDDKTVRIWQLPKGRLIRVLRVPIATGFEGRLYALDIHPDGRTIATGGWTGWEFDGEASIYLFNGDTGELVRRIGGFPETIGALAFSADGRHLIVGLQGATGLRILRTSDYAEVARDTEYGDRILNVGLAKDGRLAVASLDGYIRLYDAQFRLIGRRKTTTGKQPLSVKFSPDGRYLGVAFHDPVTPAIYSTHDLSLSHSLDASAIRDQRHLQCINWSESGDAIYAVGESADVGVSRIYRWSDAGRGQIEVIEVSAQRPAGLLPLTKGRMAFTSEDPAIGIVDATRKVRYIATTDLPDLRLHSGPIRLSHDASAVEFHGRQAKATRYLFSLRARKVDSTEAASPSMNAPRQNSDHFVIKGWQNETTTVVNGTSLKLDDYETSRSYAVSPDDSLLVLGTEWALRAYDRNAKPVWTTRMSGVVWQVAVSSDGQTVVAALSDGTLRWLRAKDGVEYMAVFVHLPTLEWIAWTPSGYYVSSNNGDRYIGWHLNQGRDATPRFFRAEQFERLLYRPDVVDAAFRKRDATLDVAELRSGELFDISRLASIAPPVVRLTDLSAAAQPSGEGSRARLRIEARAESNPMRDLAVFVNNIPVTPRRARGLREKETTQLVREVGVDLEEAENTIRVEIFNGRAMGVGEIVVDAEGSLKRRPQPGNLYVLAVGINKFPLLRRPDGGSADLEFAARDAEEIARFFMTNGTHYFQKVFARSVSDESGGPPTRVQIVRALDFLAEAGERDTVVLFLASHGVSDPGGNYYFVPADGRTEDWPAAETGRGQAPSFIHWSVFFDALRQTAGRRILIVDTCQARGIEGRVDLHSLAKRSASSLFSLVVAAKDNEESQELQSVRHGLFTYAFLEALRGGASADGEGYVTLGGAFKGTLPIVDKLRHPRHPQTPQLIAPKPLENTVLTRRAL